MNAESLTTGDNIVEESRLVSVDSAVGVDSGHSVLYLRPRVEASSPQAPGVGLGAGGDHQDVAWLKVGVLQTEHTLPTNTHTHTNTNTHAHAHAHAHANVSADA